MINRRTMLASALAGTTIAALGMPARAQSAKPLRIIVGYPAGGTVDNLARALGEELRLAYPAGVIVENKVGAGGRIAVDFVKRADPDGSTVLLTPLFVMTVFPYVYRQLGYDVVADFKPVGGVASYDYTITVGPAVPSTVATLKDYIEWARPEEKRRLYGIPAPASTFLFLGTQLARASGVNFVPVPYKGGPPLIADLLGGHIPAGIETLTNTLPHHQSGKLRILAIAGDSRSPFVPAVPTAREAGFDLVARELMAVYVPIQVTDAVLRSLQEALMQANNKVKRLLPAMQLNPEPLGSTELSNFTNRELGRWKSVIQASGFKPED